MILLPVGGDSRSGLLAMGTDLLDCNEFHPIPLVGQDQPSDEPWDLGPHVGHPHSSKTLGLHVTSGGSVCPSHFVGARWLGSEGPLLVVRPKIARAVPLGMARFCWTNGVPTDDVLDIDLDGKEVPLDAVRDLVDDVRLFLSMQYVKSLSVFLNRHFRRLYMPHQETLRNRVKGKILVAEQCKHNAAPNRWTHVRCSFSQFTVDNWINRLLKRAAVVAEAELALAGATLTRATERERRFIAASLAEVQDVRVTAQKAKAVPLSGSMTVYRSIVRQALLVLRFAEEERTCSTGNLKGSVPQFAMDMNRLFELYVEAFLSRAGFQAEAQKPYRVAGSGLMVKPDLIGDDGLQSLLLECKYVPDGQIDPSHIYQVVAYAAHKSLRGSMRLHKRIGIAYPRVWEGGEPTAAQARSILERVDDPIRDFCWCGDCGTDNGCEIHRFEIPVPCTAGGAT